MFKKTITTTSSGPTGEEVFEGSFVEGVPQGRGKVFVGGNIVYEGMWEQGERCGDGVLYEVDGSVVYTGSFIGNKKLIGKQMWVDGRVYEGEWVNDVPLGWFDGELLSNDGNVETFAGFLNTQKKREGWGKLVGNGYSYIGEWDNDLKHGQGVYKDARGGDEEIFEGSFVCGERKGFGSELSSTINYVGMWDKVPHGTGRATSPLDGSIIHEG